MAKAAVALARPRIAAGRLPPPQRPLFSAPENFSPLQPAAAGVGHACSPVFTAAGRPACAAGGGQAGVPGAEHLLVLQGESFLVVDTEAAVPAAHMFALGGAGDCRAEGENARGEQVPAAGVKASEASLHLVGLLGSLDLDGPVAWEELQAGSVMKKRKKAMNKHKWKKRRKRDRGYSR